MSSFFVLVAGLLLHFFKDSAWTDYLDPVFSLLIVGIILFTTIPLGLLSFFIIIFLFLPFFSLVPSCFFFLFICLDAWSKFQSIVL